MINPNLFLRSLGTAYLCGLALLSWTLFSAWLQILLSLALILGAVSWWVLGEKWLTHKLVQRGLWSVLGLTAIFVILFQIPPIRTQVTFPLVASAFPDQNILAPLGFTEGDYAIYQQIKGESVRLYDPRPEVNHNPFRFFGYVIIQTPDENRFKLNPLVAWRTAKYPSYLKEAGVTHLYVDGAWVGYLTEEDYNLLNNPDYYRLVLQTGAPLDPHTRYLYEVIGTDAPPHD